MGLTTWKDAPDGKIQRFDVVIAKNYLTKEELSSMARIVNAYLDLAELRAEEEVPMTMEDWAEQFEGILRLSKKEILTNAGSISAKIAEEHALTEFEKYRVKQDKLYQSDFDKILIGEVVDNEIDDTEDNKTTRMSFKMSDNHDLLNDNDMYSFRVTRQMICVSITISPHVETVCLLSQLK